MVDFVFRFYCRNKIQSLFKIRSRTDANIHHEYNNDYLNSDKIANIYFTSDVDARNRVRDLNEYNKINLNEMREEKICLMMEFSILVKTVIIV